jgi:hypothetical protein
MRVPGKLRNESRGKPELNLTGGNRGNGGVRTPTRMGEVLRKRSNPGGVACL